VKTLHLLRHAKSNWSDPALADHDRPLNKRGTRTLPILARHVADWRVDLVVASTALRARATAEAVAASMGAEMRDEPRLYAAYEQDVLDVIRALPDSVDTAMLVGHNPWIEELTELLCGSTPSFPTGALGTVTLRIDHWSEAGLGRGTLTAHVTPKDLPADSE
jgi:phosphohistidine phosphatase